MLESYLLNLGDLQKSQIFIIKPYVGKEVILSNLDKLFRQNGRHIHAVFYKDFNNGHEYVIDIESDEIRKTEKRARKYIDEFQGFGQKNEIKYLHQQDNEIVTKTYRYEDLDDNLTAPVIIYEDKMHSQGRLRRFQFIIGSKLKIGTQDVDILEQVNKVLSQRNIKVEGKSCIILNGYSQEVTLFSTD